MDTTDRAALYTQFLEQAAKEYRCAATDMPAKMAASRRLSFELYTARLIEGHNPDPATLRWFLEEEQRCMPPPEVPRVSVTIVDTLHGVCEKCGHVQDTGEPVPPPDPPPSPKRPSTPPPASTDTNPSTPPAPAASGNVVPLRRGVSSSAFHDQIGTPLKRLQAPNPAASYGSDNPFAPTGPMPDWGAAHSLPPIPPECFPK